MTAPTTLKLPPNLPDTRTAERLLDILDTLERSLQEPRKGETVNIPNPALQTLRAENTMLKARQAAAKARLEALLARLKTAAAEEAAMAGSTAA